MKKFLWIAFLSFCFSGVAAESDWNADSVQVYFRDCRKKNKTL